jgi:hypothetical protein
VGAKKVYDTKGGMRHPNPRVHSGDPRVHSGDPRVHFGDPRVHFGDPWVHFGDPRVHFGDPRVHIGYTFGDHREHFADLSWIKLAELFYFLPNVLSLKIHLPRKGNL